MIPFLGAAAAIGFAALAITRRAARGHLDAARGGARFELDPLGPEGEVGDPSELTPRTEAEALAGVGIAWPLMPPSPAGDAPIHASVPDRGEVPGSARHEVSSMLGSHAIAPDALAAGEELVDPGAIEVPIGHSADEAYDFRLSKDKLPQPETTGGVLKTAADRSGFSQIEEVFDIDIDFDDLDEPASTERALTADHTEHPIVSLDAYDTVLPEDLGTEWLSRATEAPSTLVLDPIDDLAEIPSDTEAVLSEASENAAAVPSDDVERTRSPLADDEVEVPKDLWDAFERSRR